VLDTLDVDGATAALVDQAAAYGRWDLVVGLVERGAPISTTGRTPLHLAAGAGELEVMKVLLDHGADPNAIDPDYHATPAQWAQFLRHPDVAAYLTAAAESRVTPAEPDPD
jgi:ankyrin repeat protein